MLLSCSFSLNSSLSMDNWLKFNESTLGSSFPQTSSGSSIKRGSGDLFSSGSAFLVGFLDRLFLPALRNSLLRLFRSMTFRSTFSCSNLSSSCASLRFQYLFIISQIASEPMAEPTMIRNATRTSSFFGLCSSYTSGSSVSSSYRNREEAELPKSLARAVT